MEIIIQVTAEDLQRFGTENQRPISKEAAEIGLEKAKEKLDKHVTALRREWLSKALDVARFRVVTGTTPDRVGLTT